MKKLIGTILMSVGLACALQAYAEDEPKPFSLEGEIGLIATTGNTETTSFKAKLAAHQELAQWSNDYTAEGLFSEDEVTLESGEEEKQTTAQKYFLSGQGNYKLENPDHRVFLFGSYEDDRFSNFEFQSTIAVGWNQKLWDTETSKLEYSLGPGYSFAETKAGDTLDGPIVRAAIDYQWRISATATFKQLLSTEAGEDNTKSKSETSLSAQIGGALAMKLSLAMDHNTDVPGDAEELDTQTAVTLVYILF